MFFIFFFALAYPQQGTTYFRTIALPEGNKQTEVFDLLQDSKGYMWFGTTKGLFRFDGIDFKIYRNEYGDKDTLADDIIYSVEEDATGNIWIGTKTGGISVLNPATDSFSHYRYDPKSIVPFSNYFIADIYKDTKGTMWVGSLGGGLGKYVPKTDAIHYYQKSEEDNSIAHNHVTGIMEDEIGNIWLGFNGGGIAEFNPVTEHFKSYPFSELPDATANFRNNVIRDMYDDGKGNIWLATYGGFNKFTKASGKYTHYDKSNVSLIKNNSLNSISVNDNILYITAYDGQFYKFDLTNELFISSENMDKNIRSGYMDKEKSFWLGSTIGEIIVRSSNLDFSFYSIGKKDNLVSSIVRTKDDIFCGTSFSGLYSGNKNVSLGEDILSDLSILTMEQGFDDTIWIGTNSGGINLYNTKTGENKIVRFQPGNTKGLSHDTVLDIHKDEFGDIWVSTYAGLGQWVDSTRHFLNRGSAQFKDVIRLGKNELWAATNIGIAIIDPITNAFYMKQADPGQPKDSLLHNEVNVLYTPDKDSILIGTKKGLNVFIKSLNKMVNVHEIVDIPYIEIKSITQDQHKKYWMVSDQGILHLDLANGIYKYYDESNGLKANTSWNCSLQFNKKTKTIDLGGIGGYYSFIPAPLHFDKEPVPVTITNVKLFNEDLKGPTRSNTSRSYKSNLELAHDQHMISFSYAGLNFMNPFKISYAYLLEGLDQDWIYTKNRTANFTNLTPGEYTFKVKATNSDGVWNEVPTSFRFIIKPPFWATWWAYLIYILLSISIVYAITRTFILRERLKTSLRLEHMEMKKLQELSDMKSRFFTNMSHEFRTPLTLIAGPVDKLLEHTEDAKTKENLQIVKRNSQQLKRLIDQLLEFSKLEANKVEVKRTTQELFGFLGIISSSFSSLAENNGIHYSVKIPSPELWASFDKEKVEMVINNLVSNAIKFTPESGTVNVSFKTVQEDTGRPQLLIRVEDSGPGLDKKEKEKIFERFYRVQQKDDMEGTGIGLALTKEIVELLQGSIKVYGEKGMGSIFEVVLPLELTEIPLSKSISPLQEGSIIVEKPIKSKKELNKVLLVEDNKDLRNHIKNVFGNQWHVIEASNGVEGLAIAKEEIPDLIISDLMMPNMDGNELCRNIRLNPTTDHIPFVMLTAKASQQDKLKGLEHGANDYLTKPFNNKELRLKVNNLLRQREKVQKKIQRKLLAFPQPVEVHSQEDRFMYKLRELIFGHLTNPNLNVTFLSSEMGISRVQLYRKVLASTGLSTTDFIRNIRIHKAAELFKGKWGTVSEVAYEVGFNNLSYFTRCFKDIYGSTPSSFLKSFHQA
ncbi:MAG: response regulator [Saonia sp.]